MPEYAVPTPLNQINTESQDTFIPLQSIYSGVRVSEDLKRPVVANKRNVIKDFFIRCRSNFVAKLCAKVQKRFDFDDLSLLLVCVTLFVLQVIRMSRLHSYSVKNILLTSAAAVGVNI